MLGSFAAVSVQAQEAKRPDKVIVAQVAENTTFEVKGNCGMCKKRIEKAALGLEGVQSVAWDVKTKVLAVKYDPAKVTGVHIQQKVASVGHDTEQIKATDEVYNSLPGCCKYERM